MKNLFKYTNLLLITGLLAVGCQDVVDEIDDPIDIIEEGALANESQIKFATVGVIGSFYEVADNNAVVTDLLSDAIVFELANDGGPSDATFPTFDDIDLGNFGVAPDGIIRNNSSDGLYNALHTARLGADLHVDRVNAIQFDDAALRGDALFWGNFVGGVTRFWIGQYFGMTDNGGGSPFDGEGVISQADIFNQAVARVEAALTTATPAQTKIANSMLAKINLGRNNFAAAAAALGGSVLVDGDAPFQAEYTSESRNNWDASGGDTRVQVVVAQKIIDFVTNDANEANRLPLVEVAGTGGIIFARQDKYPSFTSPIPLMTWQEVNLMRAELIVRGNLAGDALALVNAVRASHSIDPLATVDLAAIFVEREKELFATGTRLMDQVREGGPGFHITEGAVYTGRVTRQPTVTWNLWQFLAVPEEERLNNENL